MAAKPWLLSVLALKGKRDHRHLAFGEWPMRSGGAVKIRSRFGQEDLRAPRKRASADLLR
jgi:hypothetical protein